MTIFMERRFRSGSRKDRKEREFESRTTV